MDTSKIQEIHKQISELEKKVRETDSKKETYDLQVQIRKLQDDFMDAVDEAVQEIPGNIKVRLVVDKIVDFDTWDFKSWIGDELLEKDSLEDLDLIEELKKSVKDDIDPYYEINSKDVTIEIQDDRYK